MKKNYGGIIWTNHAIERLRERGIKQGDAWATFNRPDHSRYDKAKGIWTYDRTWRNEKIEIIAKQKPSTSLGQVSKWIILSVWSRRVRRPIKTEKKNTVWSIVINKLKRLSSLRKV